MTAEAYEVCRGIARASGSSFNAGMRLLPPERRSALYAIYALARRIDDIADGELPPERKHAALAALREALHRPADNDPVLIAVTDAARRFPIPLDAFDELIDGAEADLVGTEYRTFGELEHYCRCVAGSIGRLALGVFDCSDRIVGARLADDLGVALQIGNILRDITEDAGRGRVYLPREDLEQFGCEIADRQIVGPIEDLVRFEAQRGLVWLERGLDLVPLLDRRSAACVLAMSGKYRHLLTHIAANPGRVLHERVSLRPWEKLSLIHI